MITSFPSALCALLLATGVVAQDPGGKGDTPKPQSQEVKAGPYTIGSKVDLSLKLKDLNGKEHSLADHKGKVIVLAWWSMNCPYHKLADPKLLELSKELGGKDAVVLSVISNQTEIGQKPAEAKDGKNPHQDLLDHANGKGITFPILVDYGNVWADLFQAKTTPHTFVIDASGVLRYTGALDDSMGRGPGKVNYAREAAKALLAGKKVEVESSVPYG